MKDRKQAVSTDQLFAGDPFAGDPFDSAVSPSFPAANRTMQLRQSPRAAPTDTREVATLATLSVVFAFVFAPVGVVLGHLALSRIRRTGQLGRRRAVLGLTLSYFLLVLAIAVLVAWLLLDVGRSKTGQAVALPMPPPSVRSTVITPPPHGRPRVSVEQLRVGDCVEIQKNEPDATRPNTDQIYIYRARCEVRDGVFQVTQKSSSPESCSRGEFLTNDHETVVACFVKFSPAGT